MRNMLRLGVVILFLVAGNTVDAAPAVTLVVNCIPNPTPPPGTTCFNHTLGQPFTFWVVAVDAANQLATNYTDTVSITSSDPIAILPPPHAFTAADGSVFEFTITIKSLPPGAGSPTFVQITATDANGLTGSQFFSIAFAQPSFVQAVPMLSAELELVLGLLLSLVAIFSLRSNR